MTFPRHYKHNKIARFTVGPYEFVNHIIKIDSEAAHEDFLREVRGLLMVDQVNIVEVLNIRNERPVDLGQRTTRGALGTSGIKIQDSSAEAKNAELARRELELTQREANIAARERRLPNQPEGFDGTKEGDGVVAEQPAAQEAATEPAADSAPAAPAPTKVGGLILGNRQ